jgi:hypothetical protein
LEPVLAPVANIRACKRDSPGCMEGEWCFMRYNWFQQEM